MNDRPSPAASSRNSALREAVPGAGLISAPRKTLGLAGITVKTAALMAPGALVWVMFPLQGASPGGLGDMFPGAVLALGIAILAAVCFSQLARSYPNAGGQGSYFFAEKAFLDREGTGFPRLVRAAKFAGGWAAHLYYWVYPGVLVALLSNLSISLLGQFGLDVLLPGRIAISAMIMLLAALLAGRGIGGSSPSAVAANLMQIAALGAACVAALAFRWQNPLGITLWSYSAPKEVFLPASWTGTVFQAALGILILAGFEASTSLTPEALRPKQDIPRATILSILWQGSLVFLPGYAAFSLALNNRTTAASAGLAAGNVFSGGMPGLITQIGDALLAGNGFAFAFVLSAVCGIVLFGLLLGSIQMGVRVSFLMAQDREMPAVLAVLHDDFATPYAAVWILSAVSAVIGIAGSLDSSILTGLILAAATGVFLSYAVICGIAFAANRERRDLGPLRGDLLPLAGVALNAAMVPAWMLIGLSTPGYSRAPVLIGIAAMALWCQMGFGLFIAARRRASVQGRHSAYLDAAVRRRHRHVYLRRMRGESFASIAGTLYISEQRVREIFIKYQGWVRRNESAEPGACVDESRP